MVDHDVLAEQLTRLKLTCIRDQLDSLLDEAAEKGMTLREAVAFLVGREVARRNERRLEMAMRIADFPVVRELADFDFKAQPSVDERQVRELAASRWVAHGDAALLLGPPGSASRTWPSRSAARPSAGAARCCSPPRRR